MSANMPCTQAGSGSMTIRSGFHRRWRPDQVSLCSPFLMCTAMQVTMLIDKGPMEQKPSEPQEMPQKRRKAWKQVDIVHNNIVYIYNIFIYIIYLMFKNIYIYIFQVMCIHNTCQSHSCIQCRWRSPTRPQSSRSRSKRRRCHGTPRYVEAYYI